MHNSFFRVSIKISFLLLCIVSSNIHAQQLNHVQGQILVQLDRSQEVKTWLRGFNNRNNTKVTLHEKISPILDIYALNFDFTKIQEDKILLAATLDRYVDAAQFNHFVNLRSTVPNDPEFNGQWQYINTGQGGGLVGADIDMDLAWDFTTGGLTAQGDTIVVCIIDDGIDNDHPDIASNLFLNHAEIPNNGIDDDNNGFIDDYRGWRTSTDNDNVYSGGGHGTPVTGIIGAKGNNNVGVAGVNWNVKLMIVRGGSGLESEVLEAYSYPLSFRKKYNETNGAEGAFVVSTNASWGTDFGQPDNAPLWCAFYDTLGNVGILNCGATINGNQNVDEVGDLPTACPSKHLVSVTNMNRNDVKVTGAGFGLTTIDLGAFGAETWTVAFGGGYGPFGGTSGATPHVTGTIALLYSLECPNLITLAKENPGEAASLLKQVILDGTDPNTSLEGITVSGGRLNVHNTINILLNEYCGNCISPFVENFSISNDINAEISWSTNDSTEMVNLRWRKTGEIDWLMVNEASSPYTFANLEMCESYEFQLQSICTNSEGEYGSIKSFKTEGCCLSPDNLISSNIDANNATIAWANVPAAMSYNIRYKKQIDTDWIELNVISETITLSNLDPCNFYEVQIQTVCNLASPSFTNSFVFFTSGCEEGCTQLPYCGVFGYNSSEEWIATVTLNNKENISVSNNGYGQFFDMDKSIELSQGAQYEMSIKPVFAGNTFSEYFRVWIDYNQDGELHESDELVLSVDDQQTTVTGTFLVPEDAILGNTRMRVAMRYNNPPSVCVDESFTDFGEVEDYCINIVEFICPKFDSTSVESITTNSAFIAWTSDINISQYLVQYRVLGEFIWIDQLGPLNGVELEDLEICTEYEYRMVTTCTNNSETQSEIQTFKTSCTSQTENQGISTISIYPNPFENSLTVNLGELQDLSKIQIEVTNQLGQLVLIQDIQSSDSMINIPTNSLSSALYILNVKSEGKIIKTKKIIKL